ncbi:hypothetical protein Dshi_0264 [Dinoroseobacter shibae DFL 12 = DSM 16493]|jgi:hypothetical protein|uniref:Hedgehog/Intein (Hint) domain-containing protein n=1 Tax=Dinoroseobacter shibae (strain DSM 16493 / NCIMB 14021 / DFL 12) TaxID=398580 RepID=A8LLK3_DINSH|nr:Hint domain-containing protein [Dinoroseobacter shibae]ABV92013.1 hypothetical protein Dshi_0264 [Dinoroseobacter shibae DFL 12 = DSM 16493]URF46980.1 Hint domain-containing protein [Dinoroseobacter shibae]URF51291.1 Hint domain-containing protein [Dinoroseobacter shibae]
MSVFEDKINDYSNGAQGTLTTPSGQSVGYTVSSSANTMDWGVIDDGAQVAQSGGFVEVTFDVAVQNAAIHISSSNVGEDYVVEVDGQPTDLNAMIAAGQATFHNFGGNQIINPDGGLTATGSYTTMDAAVLQFHVPITSVKVSGDGSGGGWDVYDIGFAGASLPCFRAGTRIVTPKGAVPVESLRPGDEVLTLDHEVQTVLWAGARQVSLAEQIANARLRPVRIAAGALGPGCPARPLWLSRQHRVLLTRADGAECLVPVAKLLGCAGVEVAGPTRHISYHHLLFAQHEVLQAEGLACESLFWGARSLLLFPAAARAVPAGARAELAKMTPARPFIERRSALRAWLEPSPVG